MKIRLTEDQYEELLRHIDESKLADLKLKKGNYLQFNHPEGGLDNSSGDHSLFKIHKIQGNLLYLMGEMVDFQDEGQAAPIYMVDSRAVTSEVTDTINLELQGYRVEKG